MIIKRYFIYLSMVILITIFTGCATQGTHTPSVQNISDIELKVADSGAVKLKKTHIYADGKTSIDVENISKTSKTTNSKGYEVIPNFAKVSTRSLALKNRRYKEKKQIKISGDKVKVSVESIPLGEFINLMFANVLKLNYTLDKGVDKLKTPITLNMTNLQSKQSVFDVVSKILSINGVGIKDESGTFFLYIKNDKIADNIISDISIGYGRYINRNIPDDKMILQFVPYYYISGGQTPNILRQIGMKSIKFFYTVNHIQMMQGNAGDIRKALSIVNLIDRPYLEGKKLYLVNLETIEVAKFISDMKKIFKLNGIPVSPAPSKSGIVLSPIPEINSLLAVSPKKEWIDMILFWKEKLDVESQMSPTPKFYIYKVKNRKADELAKALNSVIDIKLSSTIADKKEIDNKAKTAKSKKTVTKKKKVSHSVKYDLATNTLMMQMLPSEYREVLPLIEQLDALPKQVLVEVTIAEVTLTDDFSLGFEYALRNNSAALSAGLTSSDILTSTINGSGMLISYLSKNIDATINAYASKKLLSILSKPKILILNNETGNINVGTQVPIITSETSAADVNNGTAPTIVRNVKYTNTGVIVGLSPTINSNGILTMKINLNLSEAQLNDTSGIDSPLIVTRDLSTTLTLKSGETVLLGGLISKNRSKTDKGVPVLMDLPWAGSLFKTNSDTVAKTELIMLIKPIIIKSTNELKQKTKKFRSLLHLLDQYSIL